MSGILGFLNRLLPFPRLDEELDPFAIPPSVPNTQVSSRMLVLLRCGCLLHHLDSVRKHLRLCARASLLDQGTRALPGPIRHVVHQRRHQHHDRLRYHHPPDACNPASAARKTTEVSSYWYLRCWWLVSSTFPFHVHMVVA